MEEAAKNILSPFYDRLHRASLPKETIPRTFAPAHGSNTQEQQQQQQQFGGDEGGADRHQGDKDFWATPDHLRGLDRVVDPLAPPYMASR